MSTTATVGPGRITLARQQRTDGTTPIALLGLSDSETQFRIRAIILSIYGRTRLQMEHEVNPLGELFDGLNTVTGDYVDVGDEGEIEMDRLVSALSPDTPHHWRVRAKYDLAKTPFQRNGPWLQVPVNGWNEADLRTADALASRSLRCTKARRRGSPPPPPGPGRATRTALPSATRWRRRGT